jgi:hypothetical protein
MSWKLFGHGMVSSLPFSLPWNSACTVYKYGLPLVLWVSIVMENDKLLLDKSLLPVDEQ